MFRLLKKLDRMQALRDELVLKRHIRRYMDIQGIIGIYLHNIKNALLRKDLKKISTLLKDLSSLIENDNDLLDKINFFEKNRTSNALNKIYTYLIKKYEKEI